MVDDLHRFSHTNTREVQRADIRVLQLVEETIADHVAPDRRQHIRVEVSPEATLSGDKAMLLTSDIEAISEQAMVGRHGKRLAADVMTVPHHGSRTSSTPAFVAAVGAREVIFPVGYRNRFGHPKEDVVARYVASGARLHRSDLHGALRVDLAPQGIDVHRERDESRRYWHGETP